MEETLDVEFVVTQQGQEYGFFIGLMDAEAYNTAQNLGISDALQTNGDDPS